MLSLFYHASFCAECGNEMERLPWWRHRYLCVECAALLGFGRRRVLIGLLAGVVLLVAVRCATQRTKPKPQVSAWDATALQTPPPKIEKPARVQCGARTLRGTPCKRLAAAGERCAQHQGKPSMLR